MYKYLVRFNILFKNQKIIEKVKIQKETRSSVWRNGNAARKRTQYEGYYDTFEEAKKELLKDLEAKRKPVIERLEKLDKDIEKANNLMEL